MKAFSQHGVFLRRFVALSVVVLTACSDGGEWAKKAGPEKPRIGKCTFRQSPDRGDWRRHGDQNL